MNEILDQLYDSEITFKMHTEWDAGYFAALGNMYSNVWGKVVYGMTFQEVVTSLAEQAVLEYPDSQFAFWMQNGTIEGYVPCRISNNS